MKGTMGFVNNTKNRAWFSRLGLSIHKWWSHGYGWNAFQDEIGRMHVEREYQFDLQGHKLTFVLVVGERDAIRRL